MHSSRVGLLFGALLLSGACTPKEAHDSVEGGGAVADAAMDLASTCAKIAALTGATSPRERDICLGEARALGPNMRACFIPCIARATDEADYQLCKDECTSLRGLARTICERELLGFEREKLEECVVRFTKLLSADRPKALCVEKCVARSREPNAKLATCATTCGAPALTPP